MLRNTFGALFAISFTVLIAQHAAAVDLGKFEYRNSCVQCHGVSGKGDGPVAEHLKTPPSDLTVLQKNNGGIFPVERVFATIDGNNIVVTHGSRDMPIWGDRFLARPQNDEDAGFVTEKDAREYSRGRILALIEYLSKMQAE